MGQPAPPYRGGGEERHRREVYLELPRETRALHLDGHLAGFAGVCRAAAGPPRGGGDDDCAVDLRERRRRARPGTELGSLVKFTK